VATIDRALALLETGEATRERAALLAAKARTRMLQGRQAEATEAGHEALAVARAIGDVTAETSALNSIGHAHYLGGDLEAGVAALREALEIAREHRLAEELQRSYLNLADILHVAGRSDESLEVARRGLRDMSDEGRGGDWLELFIAEVSFDLGDWDGAHRAMPSERRRLVGNTLLHRRLIHAMLLLGRGEDEPARKELETAARGARDSIEPQFLSLLGALTAELERRTGGIAAARAAVDEALDRIEFCSDDLARIALVASVGLQVEADAAQLARDRHDAPGEREARERAARMAERVRLAGEPSGPVAVAQIPAAEAELARANGDDDPALWAASAAAWEQLPRPYPAAYARRREAEALLEAGDRDGARAAMATAHEAARRLGSKWLASELEALAARARMRLDGAGPDEATRAEEVADPFGLTAREREVLALVAAGATNREIGGRLHMAEKTASVHVSRILAKLDVRSRTEAAAVAHRHGLADAAETPV
jgi:DNA-binding CsgD family transcriptional regulator